MQRLTVAMLPAEYIVLRPAQNAGPRMPTEICNRFKICNHSFSLRTWMMLLINRSQPIQSHVRVHLCCRDVGMSQDRLHGA